ncbi:unnamed protein product [Closterium sp. Naga37s-1]|nr:unnamed protein product [Closterium sp. Naga37s-1]
MAECSGGSGQVVGVKGGDRTEEAERDMEEEEEEEGVAMVIIGAGRIGQAFMQMAPPNSHHQLSSPVLYLTSFLPHPTSHSSLDLIHRSSPPRSIASPLLHSTTARLSSNTFPAGPSPSHPALTPVEHPPLLCATFFLLLTNLPSCNPHSPPLPLPSSPLPPSLPLLLPTPPSRQRTVPATWHAPLIPGPAVAAPFAGANRGGDARLPPGRCAGAGTTDLVLVQNGMLDGWLAAHGLSHAVTRLLLYMAASQPQGDAAGGNAAGGDAAGGNAAGGNAAEGNAAGMDAAGGNAAGMDAAGGNAAGMDAAGGEKVDERALCVSCPCEQQHGNEETGGVVWEAPSLSQSHLPECFTSSPRYPHGVRIMDGGGRSVASGRAPESSQESPATVCLCSHRLPVLAPSACARTVCLCSHRLPVLAPSACARTVCLCSHRLPACAHVACVKAWRAGGSAAVLRSFISFEASQKPFPNPLPPSPQVGATDSASPLRLSSPLLARRPQHLLGASRRDAAVELHLLAALRLRTLSQLHHSTPLHSTPLHSTPLHSPPRPSRPLLRPSQSASLSRHLKDSPQTQTLSPFPSQVGATDSASPLRLSSPLHGRSPQHLPGTSRGETTLELHLLAALCRQGRGYTGEMVSADRGTVRALVGELWPLLVTFWGEGGSEEGERKGEGIVGGAREVGEETREATGSREKGERDEGKGEEERDEEGEYEAMCERLCAYSMAIPTVVPSMPMALAEFPWRNGWFLRSCSPTPTHTRLLASLLPVYPDCRDVILPYLPAEEAST